MPSVNEVPTSLMMKVRGALKISFGTSVLALLALRFLTPWWHRILRRTLFFLDDVFAAILAPGHERYGQRYLKGYWEPIPLHNAGKVRVGLLPIEGQVPQDLRGVFLRNGPNPPVSPRDGYHAFGGDGYINAVRFPGDGTVSYSGDFARTPKVEAEIKAGEALYMNLGDVTTGRPGFLGLSRIAFDALRKITGAVPPNPTNHGVVMTSILHHHRRIYALSEGSLPFEISYAKDGTLGSKGFYDFGGELHSITAHPKVDPVTGELIFFSYTQEPFVWYGVTNREGKMLQHFKFPIPHPVMIHDCAVTEHWTIIFDLPVLFEPKRLVSHGEVLYFDKSHPAALILIPRHAKGPGEIHRIPLREPFYSFHTVAAWEKEGELTLFFARSEELSMSNFETFKPHLWRFDVRLPGPNGEAPALLRETQLSSGEKYIEFPALHPNFVLNARWAWISTTKGGGEDGLTGIQKWDLQSGKVVAEFVYGDDSIGAEAIFAPRSGAPSEENGYLIMLIHNHKTWQTCVGVYDARTMQRISLTPMPHPIPMGFHALWLSEEELHALPGW